MTKKLTKTLELIRLGKTIATRVCVWNLEGIHNDTIVVNFTKVICLAQVTPRDFVVIRQVVTFSKAADPDIDILNSGVAVYERDVVVS